MKTKILACLVLIAADLALPSQVSAETSVHTIEVTERHLFGPGPFPDQKLKTAWIRNLKLDSFLNGIVKGANNLGAEPNVSGEKLQGKIVDGMLSDKTLINEDIDMANAVIMNGQFNLLLAAVYGGSNNGDTFFYRDDDYNWWIKDDIAIDPGFPAGIVKIDNFTFTTGPRLIPHSVQTEMGYPGGTNQTGSLEAGRVAHGRLGDIDGDGFLDGVFNAIGRFPMESIFLPGAPFVQLFEFKSDIPVSHLQAALLNAASARSYAAILQDLETEDNKHVDIPAIKEKIRARMQRISFHLGKVSSADVPSCEECLAASSVSELVSVQIGEKSIDSSVVANVFNQLVNIHEQQNG